MLRRVGASVLSRRSLPKGSSLSSFSATGGLVSLSFAASVGVPNVGDVLDD